MESGSPNELCDPYTIADGRRILHPRQGRRHPLRTLPAKGEVNYGIIHADEVRHYSPMPLVLVPPRPRGDGWMRYGLDSVWQCRCSTSLRFCACLAVRGRAPLFAPPPGVRPRRVRRCVARRHNRGAEDQWREQPPADANAAEIVASRIRDSHRGRCRARMADRERDDKRCVFLRNAVGCLVCRQLAHSRCAVVVREQPH